MTAHALNAPEPIPTRAPSPDVRALLAEPAPEFDWLIDDLVERGDRIIVTGAEGAGKSELNRQIGMAPAAGLHPFTLQPVRPVRTLLLDVENSKAQVKRALRRVSDAAGDRYHGDHLRIELRPEGIDLTTEEGRVDLYDLLAANAPVELLIAGPIYKLATGDPNTEGVARLVIATFDRIRAEHGCAVILEGHSPHASNGNTRPTRPFGASLWLRWPEFGLNLGKDGRLTHWRGPRDERDWPDRLVRSEPWPWATATTPTTTIAADGTFRPTCLMERLSRRLEAFTAKGEHPTRNALVDAVKGKREAKRRAIEVLIDEGFATLDERNHLHSVRPYREADE